LGAVSGGPGLYVVRYITAQRRERLPSAPAAKHCTFACRRAKYGIVSARLSLDIFHHTEKSEGGQYLINFGAGSSI
jgi:hypothetical protein